MIGEVHSDINHYKTGDQSQPEIQTMTCSTCQPDQMLPPRSALEKVVEFTEHNIKVLSKVEPGLTLT